MVQCSGSAIEQDVVFQVQHLITLPSLGDLAVLGVHTPPCNLDGYNKSRQAAQLPDRGS